MPRPKGVWDTYNGYLADKREAGATLEDIGKEVGISRERVRQILVRHYGTTKMTSLLTTAQLAQLMNLSETTIGEYRKAGIIKPANDSSRHFLYGTDAIIAISTFRRCRICDKPLSAGKLSYCSPECRKIGDYESHKRCQWRILHRKTGQPITASIDYVVPGRSKFRR